MRFLHICLASVLNLRSPDDSELPGTSMDKLTSMLFGDQVWTKHSLRFLMVQSTLLSGNAANTHIPRLKGRALVAELHCVHCSRRRTSSRRRR